MDFQWHFPMDVHINSSAAFSKGLSLFPVGFHLNVQCYAPMDFHVCEFWCAIRHRLDGYLA